MIYDLIVIDANKLFLSFLNYSLKSFKCNIIPYYSPKKALEYISDNVECDLIVIDGSMSEMNSIDIAKEIIEKQIDIPIVISSFDKNVETQVNNEFKCSKLVSYLEKSNLISYIKQQLQVESLNYELEAG